MCSVITAGIVLKDTIGNILQTHIYIYIYIDLKVRSGDFVWRGRDSKLWPFLKGCELCPKQTAEARRFISNQIEY